MTVNLLDYWNKVSRFSQYPEDKRAAGYALGLLAEAGEVCGVVDKYLRGKYDEAEMRRRLVDELGDVCWYCAAGLALYRSSRDGMNVIVPYYWDRDIAELTSRLMHAADARDRWAVLDYVSSMATKVGATLEAVLDANVAKLTERHA